MCDHNFSILKILAPLKHELQCSNCGYALVKIGAHVCKWQRGTIFDLEGNEVFQISGTQAWVCAKSGESLEGVPAFCNPNQLGLKCFERNIPKDADVPALMEEKA